MSTYMYDQSRQDISMRYESAFRTPNGGSKDTALLATTVTIPVPVLPEGADIPIPIRVKEAVYGIGAGKYPSKIVTKMHEPTTITLNGLLQTGIFFAYAIGKATTAGASPYTHTVAEYIDYRIESFCMHCEQRNINTGNNIPFDILGCVVNSYVLEITRELAIRENIEIMAAYFDHSNAVVLTTPGPPGEFSDNPFTWDEIDAVTTKLKIGATDRTPAAIDKITVTIANNVTFVPTLGDPIMYLPVAGLRDITIEMHCWIEDANLFAEWQKVWSNPDGHPSGTDNLSLEMKLTRSANDYIHFKLDNLFIEAFTVHFSTAEEAVRGVDITLKAATPTASDKTMFSTAEVKDSRDNTYYHFTT